MHTGLFFDAVKRVALLDLVTLGEARRHHIAGDAWTNFDAFNGLKTAGELVELGDRLRHDLGGCHRRWSGGRLGGFIARAGGENHCGKWCHESDGS